MKKFQTIIEIEENAIINATNRKKDVDEWLKAFHEQGVIGSSIKIFEADKTTGGYSLVHHETCEEEDNLRPIGFGRWDN